MATSGLSWHVAGLNFQLLVSLGFVVSADECKIPVEKQPN